MKKIKEILSSEKGMNVVNVLFLLSVLIPNRGFIFTAYLVWIAYLIFGIKHAQSKAVQIINSVFLVFAAIMVIVNAVFLLKSSSGRPSRSRYTSPPPPEAVFAAPPRPSRA